jgi:CheY-like chemotaxis protein
MIKILVLDDDLNRLKIFRERLEKQGVLNANYVETADEAIEYLMINPDYDYIFLDHDLGGTQMVWSETNCGMNVVDYMIANGYPNMKVNVGVHSYNGPRGQEMTARLKDAGYIVQYIPGVWLNL